MENNGQKRAFWDRYALFHGDLMKNENSVQNFTLSLLQRILFIVVLLFSAMGILSWGSDMWNYWRDAAVFSMPLFWHVMVCIVLFFFCFVLLFKYRLIVTEDGVSRRYFFWERYFSFSRVTDAELGHLGLVSVLVLNEGKKRLQFDSYDFRRGDFCRFIRLVRERLDRAGYKGTPNGETFFPLKQNRAMWRFLVLFIVCYSGGSFLFPGYSKSVSDDNVGAVLYYGIGCERNTDEAAYYWGRTLEKARLAALEKYRNGQKDISAEEAYQIGCQYAGGVGVGRDLKEARNWFNKAHDLGNKRMKKRVRFMISRIAS